MGYYICQTLLGGGRKAMLNALCRTHRQFRQGFTVFTILPVILPEKAE